MGKKKKKKKTTSRKSKTDSPVDITALLKKVGAEVTHDIKHFRSPYYIPTGLFNLDFILSDGRGIPTSVIQYYGGESSGKTTAALQTMANAQARGMPCYYINAERALTESLIDCFPELDHEKVNWIDPFEGGESALDSIKIILANVPEAFVVLDSIPACLPKEVLEGEAGKRHMARLAALFSPVMPEMKRLAWANKSVVLLINQLRDNLSPVGYKPVIPGGHSVKFYSDILVKFKIGDKLKDGANGEIIGHRMNAEVEKTRGQGIGKKSQSTLIYGRGFDPCRDIFQLAVSFGLVSKSGPWFSTEDGRKAQGEAAFVKMMHQDEELKSSLEAQVVELVL